MGIDHESDGCEKSKYICWTNALDRCKIALRSLSRSDEISEVETRPLPPATPGRDEALGERDQLKAQRCRESHVMSEESSKISSASESLAFSCVGRSPDEQRSRRMSYRALRKFVRASGSFGLLLLILQAGSASSQRQNNQGPLRGQKFARTTGGVLAYELVPSFSGEFKGAPLHTNRWGMRDKDYELKPPPNTYRIALLGSSLTMGGGVRDEQTHEALLENRLNREGPGAPRRHYEILNFAVAGYGILQNAAVADTKVFPFEPQAVVLTFHGVEQDRMVAHVARLVRDGAQIEYEYVRQKLQEAGVQPGMKPPEVARRLGRIAPDLVRWSFKHVADVCREHHVPVVGILFAEPREGRREERIKALAAAAAEAGIPVIDLAGAYDGYPLDSVRLPVGDPHLNALGHQLVADRLFQLLRENDKRTLKLGFSPPRS